MPSDFEKPSLYKLTQNTVDRIVSMKARLNLLKNNIAANDYSNVIFLPKDNIRHQKFYAQEFAPFGLNGKVKAAIDFIYGVDITIQDIVDFFTGFDLVAKMIMLNPNEFKLTFDLVEGNRLYVTPISDAFRSNVVAQIDTCLATVTT